MIRFHYRTCDQDHSIELKLPIPNAEHMRSKLGADCVDLEAVELTESGIVLITSHFEIWHEPYVWGRFWPKIQHLSSNGLIAGDLACRCWSLWNTYWLSKAVDRFLEEAAGGEIRFDALLDHPPSVFENGKVIETLALAWVDGRLKGPKGGDENADSLYLLYSNATWNCISGKAASWKDACALACEQHPQLVPTEWDEFDVSERLRVASFKRFHRHRPYRLARRDPSDL